MDMKNFRKYYLYLRALPKTIIFNFKYLPFNQAIFLPVFISHRVWLMELSGQVKVHKTKMGVIKIGFGEVGIFDQMRSRGIWQVSGLVEFKGKSNIGHGSKISVSGTLIVGENVNVTAESAIIAKNSVNIGDNVLISWDSLIMDSDFHKIYDSSGNHLNPSMPVNIGCNVWIGCRVLILKGVTVAEGVVIAASSTISKSIDLESSVAGEVGGVVSVIKKDIIWKM